MAGRRFAAVEGGVRTRGVIEAATFEGNFVCLKVSEVERFDRYGETWKPREDFAYHGRRDITNLSSASDGGYNLDIMYIGSVHIFPESR